MSNSGLREVSIGDISISKTNPRKTFEEEAMKELTESIKQHGILQPILVRTLNPAGKKSKMFELVCGERRFRAAKAAGLDEIPVNIRMLTDDEAFELQIVENLERKDVHPLEEAEAFKRMLDSGKYTVQDIAAKIVKPESFVVQRLKLNDLIDGLKKDFYLNHFGVGHAILLARLDVETQKKQHERAGSGWSCTPENPDYGTIQQLKDDVEEDLYNLDEAPFDLNDDTFPSVTSCMVCPKHAAANPSLFPDVEEKDKCFDTGCYERKQKLFVERKVASIINNGEDIHLGESWRGDAPDFIREMCKQHNITILKDGHWRKEYDEEKQAKAPKMMIVGGSDAGHIMPIVITKIGEQRATENGEPGVQDQINKIEQRAKRALELDRVKVFKAMKENEMYEGYVSPLPNLTELEEKAFWYLFKKEALGWQSIREYNEMVGCPDSYNDIKEFEFYVKTPLDDLKINWLVRQAIKNNLSNMHEPDYENCTKSKFFFEIIKEMCPKKLEKIQDEHQRIADKRIERTDKKIEELKAQLKPQKS